MNRFLCGTRLGSQLDKDAAPHGLERSREANVLLRNPHDKSLWAIDAVTSDGEVDHHKVQQLKSLATRSGFDTIGFTTAYPSWKVAAARQGKHKNIAVGTFIWIAEDPSKHFWIVGS